MRLSRRALTLTAAAGLLLPLALTGCGSQADDSGAGGTQKVRFGYLADFNGTSLLAIADKQDLWKKAGLSPEIKVFTNGPVQIQALGAGDLDFGYIGPGAMWLPASGRAKIVSINTLGYADRVIAQAGIDTMADLKGKKVGVPEGTSGEMILDLALEDAGMSPKDVEKVPMDPSTVVSAFSSGQIDAAGIWYPLIDTIKQRKPDLVELATTRDMPENVFPTAFVSGTDTKSDLTKKVVKVLQEANDWRAAHPQEAVQVTAAMLKIDVAKVEADASNVETLTTDELVARTEDGSVKEWLTGLNEFFTKNGKLPKAPDPDTYYSGDLYTQVAAQ
ncbi:aliphatic sulfonate ABC transporter substrate-binding protein [Streptomyces sp. NPDC057301]|uniref:aliphatic sulfonate ABC transporter substrate-binding protein n=1 Tax=Streptomyces sp. NPDC057301 TaxID=3346093 RepID=UPI0036252FA6